MLSDGGLLEAINAQADRFPIPVNVDAEDPIASLRFSEDVEGAAYFMVCEGLANTAKHAHAHTVRVRLRWADRALAVEMADDGRGFDPEQNGGSGLRGMSDRVAALGGALEIASRPGSGTCLKATLPAELRRS